MNDKYNIFMELYQIDHFLYVIFVTVIVNVVVVG